MASEKPELDGFLAVIDAKIAALQRLRESFLAAASVGALGQPGDIDPSTLSPSTPVTIPQTPAGAMGPIELPTGVFRGKGLADAIRLYLSIAKRKQTFKEIKAALMEGGLATTSEFFDQTLNGTLHRLKRGGELIQFPDGWDLAESYPESYRQRLAQTKEEASAPKRKRKGKNRTTKRESKVEKVEKKLEPTEATTAAPTLRRAV